MTLDALFGGIVGALVVFVLGQVVEYVRRRRQLIAAVSVVTEELNANGNECRSRLSAQLNDPPPTMAVADLLQDHQYATAQLLLAGAVPTELFKSVANAYGRLTRLESRLPLGHANARGVLESLAKRFEQAAQETDSYRNALIRRSAWLHSSQRLSYAPAAAISGPV